MSIHTHRWNPPPGTAIRPQGVYLLHGIGEHAARYERFATRLAAAGWRVAAHDHPGHGRSDGRRGVAEPADQLVTAAAAQLARFAEACGAAPYLFGHSLGGVVATELALGLRVPIAGLVLSAPAIAPRLTWQDTLKLRVMSTLAPSHALELPYDATRLTHDEETIAAAHADALIHGFKSAGLIRWLIGGARRALDRAPGLDVATLVLIAGDDQLIDIRHTRTFVERAPAHLMGMHVYDDSRHELLNETPERRERVITDILRWLGERDGGERAVTADDGAVGTAR